MFTERFTTLLIFCIIFFVGPAYAGWVPPAWSYGQTIDQPAQEASQIGWAEDPRWQMLGDSWGDADGVSWAVLDNDGNPGVFGNETIHVGDQVVFKFDMYKTLYGTHDFDALRAWIDWDQDGFSWADIASDMILQDQLSFNSSHLYSDDPYAWGWMGSLYYANLAQSFLSPVISFTETGDFDLLARVLCSDDLAGDWNNLTPWANGMYQGEVEIYTIHVVPLPSALLLFGGGVISLGFFRRKAKP